MRSPTGRRAKMHIRIVPAPQHRPDYYTHVYEGFRALQLLDDAGQARGELVWRVATGETIEITEFGIYDPKDRRQGWGTRLLDAGIEDMRSFFIQRGLRFRRIYLFCDAINEPGRRFYESRGFKAQAVLDRFYHYCHAVLYVRDVEEQPPLRIGLSRRGMGRNGTVRKRGPKHIKARSGKGGQSILKQDKESGAGSVWRVRPE